MRRQLEDLKNLYPLAGAIIGICLAESNLALIPWKILGFLLASLSAVYVVAQIWRIDKKGGEVMGDDSVKLREIILTEDDWIYLQNKLESILETEEDDLLEAISATIFAQLAGLKETTEEEFEALTKREEK